MKVVQSRRLSRTDLFFSHWRFICILYICCRYLCKYGHEPGRLSLSGYELRLSLTLHKNLWRSWFELSLKRVVLSMNVFFNEISMSYRIEWKAIPLWNFELYRAYLCKKITGISFAVDFIAGFQHSVFFTTCILQTRLVYLFFVQQIPHVIWTHVYFFVITYLGKQLVF